MDWVTKNWLTSLPYLRLPPPDDSGLRRTILVVWKDLDPISDALYSHYTWMLDLHAQFEQTTSVEGLMSHLNKDDLVPKQHAVLIMDAGIFRQSEELTAEVCRQLRVYVSKQGGTLILASEFGRAPIAQVDEVFRRLGRKWRAGPVRSLMAWKDSPMWETMSGQLRHMVQPLYFPESMCLRNVDMVSQVYVCAEDVMTDRELTCPVVWEKSGEGRIGFVGDVKVRENSWKIVFAMCGL
jgi:hypothetical protein